MVGSLISLKNKLVLSFLFKMFIAYSKSIHQIHEYSMFSLIILEATPLSWIFWGSFDGGIMCILGKSCVIRLYYMVAMGHNCLRLV